MRNKFIRSPIPYMGGKFKLLKYLIPLFPEKCSMFVDLFGGSATVCANYKGNSRTIYNELNPNIVSLVKLFKENDSNKIITDLINLIDKFNLPKEGNVGNTKGEKDKKKCEERRESYNRFRDFYNKSKERDYRLLYLLSCYSINNLIRFNSDSEFNVSVGNGFFGNKDIEDIINFNNSLKNVEIIEGDAFKFNFDKLDKNSFVYCDCPYLNTEAVYNEKRAFGGWDIDCDYKLFKILEDLDKKGIKWGLSNVFTNRGKENTHLIEWCNKNGWQVYHTLRNYNPFSRGNSNNDEVYICNYKKSGTQCQSSFLDMPEYTII